MKNPRYIKDITNKKVGRLTAIKFVKRENKKSLWLFKCDCGNEKIIIGSNVMRKKVGSCGCMVKEHAQKLGKIFTLPNNESYKNRLYRSYKGAAKRRKIKFELSRVDFLKLIEMNCDYCGEPPSNSCQEGNKSPFKYNGIDRKINSLHYTAKNCAPCCYVCNKMKMTLSENDFLNQINKITRFQLKGII